MTFHIPRVIFCNQSESALATPDSFSPSHRGMSHWKGDLCYLTINSHLKAWLQRRAAVTLSDGQHSPFIAIIIRGFGPVHFQYCLFHIAWFTKNVWKQSPRKKKKKKSILQPANLWNMLPNKTTVFLNTSTKFLYCIKRKMTLKRVPHSLISS